MSTITLRNTKGSALTFTEMDNNFSNLNTDKLENVSADTTPQLGGSLDVNGNKIVSVSDGNIDIEPNGTGNVLLGNFTFDADQTVGSGQDDYVLTYNHSAGTISLEASASGGISNVVEDTTPQLGGDLDAQSNNITNLGTVNGHTIPGGTGTFALTSQLGISNVVEDTTPQLGGNLDAQSNNITSLGTVNTHTIPGGTGTFALTSDITFSNVVDDTTPQLGGQLDVNGQAIGDGTRELLTFTEDGSAVNHINIENEATGAGPILSAAGDDTNVNLHLKAKGTGQVVAESTLNSQTGTSYTAVLGDASKLITMNNASANTLTIPQNSSVAFPIGTKIDIVQLGAGQTTVTEDSNMNIRRTPTLKLRAQYSGATCIKIATNEWVLVGDLAES